MTVYNNCLQVNLTIIVIKVYIILLCATSHSLFRKITFRKLDYSEVEIYHIILIFHSSLLNVKYLIAN